MVQLMIAALNGEQMVHNREVDGLSSAILDQVSSSTSFHDLPSCCDHQLPLS